ncbi:hypothetical protein ACFQFQ_09000 [Sulfitobacter porphyrae]|uniref:Uncharacterized protein n=1 Tax=Sulfitobacter porphyrae TaxID=1246864 RepID=A0ABW2B1M9_9RHOB
MSERTDKFADELDTLIKDGEMLMMAMEYQCRPEHFRKVYSEAFKLDDDKLETLLKKLPNFDGDYQAWYSKSQALIKQVMPDRLADFISYFEVPKGRKTVDFQSYMIRDYLQGLQTSRHGEVIADRSAAIPEFRQQLNMVKAAKTALGSKLMDLKGVLQADLFDTEVETAGALAKAGYLRAAGAICGVVIEKHFRHICEVHKITVRKKIRAFRTSAKC